MEPNVHPHCVSWSDKQGTDEAVGEGKRAGNEAECQDSNDYHHPPEYECLLQI